MEEIIELRRNLLKLSAIHDIHIEKIERPFYIARRSLYHTPPQQELTKEYPPQFQNTNPNLTNSNKTPPKILTPSKSQKNMFPIEKNDLYFTNTIKNGYLNIKDSRTILINNKKDNSDNKYKYRRRKNQISQYIIQNGRSKKSHSISATSKNINFNFSDNKRRSKSRKIGLTFNLLLRKNTMNNEIHIIRGTRDEKGGVVDFCYSGKEKNEKNVETNHFIVKFSKNSILYSSKKVIENAKKIQKWWRWIKVLYKKLTIKVIRIQRMFRGFINRKNMKGLPGKNIINTFKEKEIDTEQNLVSFMIENVNDTNILPIQNTKYLNLASTLIKNFVQNKLKDNLNNVVCSMNKWINAKQHFNDNIEKIIQFLRNKWFKDFFIENLILNKLKRKYLSFLIKSKHHKYLQNYEHLFNIWKNNKLYRSNNKTNKIIKENEIIIPPKKCLKKEIIFSRQKNFTIFSSEKQFDDIFFVENNDFFTIQEGLSTKNSSNISISNINNIQINQQKKSLKVLKEKETQTDKIQIEKTIPKKKINSLKLATMINIVSIPFKRLLLNELKNASPIENSLLNQKQTLLKSKKRNLLIKQISTKDFKDKILLRIYFLRWYKKILAIKYSTKINIRKTLDQDKPLKSSHKTIKKILWYNILKDVFDKIKKEVRRRKIIKLFFHIKNLKYPTLAYVIGKIKKFSDVKFQYMNACATIIQNYFREKYILQKDDLYEENETTIKKRHIIIEESFNENFTFKQIPYESIGDLFMSFYKKLMVKCLIESLYMKSF